MILTIYESKGLEFENVLLISFFEHGQASVNDWRILNNLIEDMNAPRFEANRHAIMLVLK